MPKSPSSMLLRFAFENYGSFRHEAELSFIATGRKADAPKASVWHLDAPSTKDVGVLPVVGIYGANASGKSAVCAALSQACDHVKHSFGTSPNAPIDSNPFRLDLKQPNAVQRYTFDFVVSGKRHIFTFSHDRTRFLEESLIRYESNRPSSLFFRGWCQDECAYRWRFGDKFTGERDSVKQATRENALFLSTAAQFNNETLNPIFDWFDQQVAVIIQQPRGAHAPHRLSGFVSQRQIDALRDESRRVKLAELLRSADLGIVDARAVPFQECLENIELRPQPPMSPDLTQEFNLPTHWPQFLHSADGGPRPLPYSLESSGTQRWFAFLPSLVDALESGGVMVSDELDAELHPSLMAEVVRLFNSPTSNPNGAQLLCALHDTSLLSRTRHGERVLGRDQIWLTEKAGNGESQLRPLSEYKIVENADVERGYLEDRYGGIAHPVLSDFRPRMLVD